jgi:hypothetical protein
MSDKKVKFHMKFPTELEPPNIEMTVDLQEKEEIKEMGVPIVVREKRSGKKVRKSKE